MRWSKLRKLLRELLTPELKTRIDFHCTRYNGAHDEEGEAWITVDNVKIIGGGYYHWMTSENLLDGTDESMSVKYGCDPDFTSVYIRNGNIEKVMKSGVHDTHQLVGSLFNYLNTPFKESLHSNNPFFRALSIADKRLGRRRFDEIHIDESDHPLVRKFYELRKDCFRRNSSGED